MVVQEGTGSNFFQTLSLAFGESLEIMAEKIRKELTKVNHLVSFNNEKPFVKTTLKLCCNLRSTLSFNFDNFIQQKFSYV